MFLEDMQSDQPRLELRQSERTISQVYELSLQSEWQLMRHYSAGDFGHRYGWPKMERGARDHFFVDDQAILAQ